MKRLIVIFAAVVAVNATVTPGALVAAASAQIRIKCLIVFALLVVDMVLYQICRLIWCVDRRTAGNSGAPCGGAVQTAAA